MVLLQMNPQTGRQQRENYTKPKWKNYDFYYVFVPITTSRCIAVNWYLRVYWVLPFRIVDSFAENRRFFCRAPTILLLRIDDSFGKHRRLFCWAPWILGPVHQLHFPKDSFPAFSGLFFSSSTEIVDSLAEVYLNQQTPATRPSYLFPDFIIFVRHHIAHNDIQWVR